MTELGQGMALLRTKANHGRMAIQGFTLGMAAIATSIIVGGKHVFYVGFIILSMVMTYGWRRVSLRWTTLVSVSTAIPIAITKQKFSCNVIFAFWSLLLSPRYLLRLPRWIYLPFVLASFGFFTSSVNWLGENMSGGLLRQGAHACNFILAPFLLVPITYVRMKENKNHLTNLKCLLFCLVLPSTLILLSAKLFGTITNLQEAARHTNDLPEGFLQYALGNVVINFLRTEVGFILAALICASSAIVMSRIQVSLRVVAGACLTSNLFLLLATGSIGSMIAGFCGLAAMLLMQVRMLRLKKLLFAIAAVGFAVAVVYGISPPSMKKYLSSRYEDRIVDRNQDRLSLWKSGIHAFMDHPGGVGFTLSFSNKPRSFIHNDYIAYAVSYGVTGGVAYSMLVITLLLAFFHRGKYPFWNESELAIYLAGMGVMVSAAVNSMTDHMTENRWYFNLIWSLIWYCYFCSRRDDVTVSQAVATTIIPGDTRMPVVPCTYKITRQGYR